MTPVNRITINVKPDRERTSEGPSAPPPFKRDAKARAKYYSKQTPFHEGRKVAFHAPSNSGKGDADAEGDENTWILAVITQCLSLEKNR